MKDSEFIELLNLYLDHEISAADSARLEAEVQTNPARRKIYEQYCRMQKACKVLASDFVSAEEAAASPDNKKIVAFNVAAAEAAASRRKRAGNLYMLGTVAAAAACVAIVFVGQNRQSQSSQAPADLMATSSAQPVAERVATVPVARETQAAKATMVAAAPAAGPRALGGPQNAHATLVSDTLSLSGKAQADAVMAAAMEQAKAQLAWIDALKFAPIQQPAPINDLRFENTPATLRPEGRQLGNRATNEANLEMTAIQFRK